MQPARVALVGAGQIGAACVRGLLRAGHSVRVHDPSEANRAQLEAAGASWAPSLDAVLNVSDGGHDVLCTALPAPPHVRAVMEGEQGLMSRLRPDALWIDHTTTDPDEAIRLHSDARTRGLRSLEAPLTGGYELLRAGMMTALVGGDAQHLASARPILDSYTATVLHMGGLGKASVVKLITNQLAAVHLVAAGEAALMARQSGVDLSAFFDGVRASAGNSFVFETETPLMFNGSYQPGFAIALHCKDLAIARKVHSAALGDATYDHVYRLHALAEREYEECMAAHGGAVGSSYPAKSTAERVGADTLLAGFEDWGYAIEKVSGGSIGVVHKNRK